MFTSVCKFSVNPFPALAPCHVRKREQTKANDATVAARGRIWRRRLAQARRRISSIYHSLKILRKLKSFCSKQYGKMQKDPP